MKGSNWVATTAPAMDILSCATLSLGVSYLLRSFGNVFKESFSTAFLAIFTLQYLAIKGYRIFLVPHFLSVLRDVPGPKDGHFLIGQAYKLFQALPAQQQLSWMRKFPDAPLIRYFSFANKEIILLNSPQAHKEVLQTQCYSFVKPSFHSRIVGDIAGKGLLFAEGDQHKTQRRLLVGPFSFGNIKNLLPYFNLKAAELCGVIAKELHESSSNVIEVTSLLEKATLDIVSLAVLGYKSKALSSKSSFAEAYKTVFELPILGQIIAVVHQYVPIRSWLPLRVNRDFVNANTQIRNLLRDQIRERKKAVAEKGMTPDVIQKSRDLLTLMVEERSGGTVPWTEDEMLNHLLNFMAAGHETTAGALTWTLHTLSTHPKIQARLLKEVKQIIPESQAPTYDQIESLHYLNNFTREVLRVFPPGTERRAFLSVVFTKEKSTAVYVPREAAKDVTICGVFVPKGTVIVIVPAVSHFNPHIWGPNADEFDPDRWDNLPEAATNPFTQQSFLSGPRVCIGKAFALLEYKAILIDLVRNFVFEAGPDKVELTKGAITLRPSGGLKVGIVCLQDKLATKQE